MVFMGNENVLPRSKSGEKETTHIINSYNINTYNIPYHWNGLTKKRVEIEK